MNIIAWLINAVITILFWLILVDVIGSWLAAAGTRLPGVIYELLVVVHRIVEPLLAPIRRVLPSFGGLDLSPLILLVLLQIVARLVLGVLGAY